MMKRLGLLLLLAALAVESSADWRDFPVAGDTFSGNGSLKWSVDVTRNGSAISYAIVDGNTCIVSFALLGTGVTGYGNVLRIKLPPGMMPARYVFASGTVVGLNGGAATPVALSVSDDGPFINISPWSGAYDNPPADVAVMGQIVFPVCFGCGPDKH